jgi:AAA+ superfamily predicted ATPase
MQSTSKSWGLKEGLVFLVAAADSTEDITSSIRRCFSHEISMGAPTETQRIKLLSNSVHSVATGFDNVRNQKLVILLPFLFFWISRF